MSTEISYTKAFEELQNIANEIEQGQISVDELSKKVKRASELIKICNEKLYATEEDVKRILEELEADSSVPSNTANSSAPGEDYPNSRGSSNSYMEALDDLPF